MFGHNTRHKHKHANNSNNTNNIMQPQVGRTEHQTRRFSWSRLLQQRTRCLYGQWRLGLPAISAAVLAAPQGQTLCPEPDPQRMKLPRSLINSPRFVFALGSLGTIALVSLGTIALVSLGTIALGSLGTIALESLGTIAVAPFANTRCQGGENESVLRQSRAAIKDVHNLNPNFVER
jgi:hypothetical protein